MKIDKIDFLHANVCQYMYIQTAAERTNGLG